MSVGLYAHLPFCKSRCYYCAFYSQTANDNYTLYVKSLINEAEHEKDFLPTKTLNSVYLGGGTPSLLNVQQLATLFNGLKNIFSVADNAEITIEVNPDDVTEDYIKDLKMYTPINRISIGIQSFNDEELKIVNRRHNASTAKKALEIINKFYDNFSLDFIYGLPLQTCESWQDSINTALSFNPKHISAYSLSVEHGTYMEKMAEDKTVIIPDENFVVDCYNIIKDMLDKHGFIHYEISNYCLKDFEAKHNTNYWNDGKYLGLGAGAHSFNGKIRRWNVASVDEYMRLAGIGNFYGKENIDKKTAYNEYIMLGLRTKKGINLDNIEKYFGEFYVINTKKYLSQIPYNHLIVNGLNYNLNDEGMLLADRYSVLFVI